MESTTQRRWLIISGLLIIFAIALFLIPRRESDLDRRSTGTKSDGRLRVSNVIDGDTFELSDGRRIRLIGVDTPEIDQPFYDEAVAFAESLLKNQVIDCEFDKENSDKYGRLLAYIFVDSCLVNETVVARGLGMVYLFDSNLIYAERLIESQKMARKAKIGIWSLPRPAPEEYYIRLEGSFRFHRPLCPAIKNSDPRKRIEYYSRDILLDAGISPCRNCRP